MKNNEKRCKLRGLSAYLHTNALSKKKKKILFKIQSGNIRTKNAKFRQLMRDMKMKINHLIFQLFIDRCQRPCMKLQLFISFCKVVTSSC